MKLKLEHCKDFGKIKAGLMKQTFKVGFSCILDTGQAEDHKMMKDKLTDGKELKVGLKVNQSR